MICLTPKEISNFTKRFFKLLLSVIMATRNDEKNLVESIDSILNQTYNNFEFLIMNDDSSDTTFEILHDYSKKDNRIRIFNNKDHLGLTKSLNILLSHSRGEIIARQDSDDYSMSQRFIKQINFLHQEKFKFCVTRAIVKNQEKLIPGISFYFPKKYVIRYKNPFIHGTLMIKKNTLIQYGGYDEKYYYAQDYKLFVSMLKNKVRYKYIKEPLYYLNTKDNISTHHRDEQNKYFELVRKDFNLKIL